MTTITVKVSRSMNVTAERVWEVIADYPNVHHYHPLVDNVDLRSSTERGVGASRVCNFYDNTSVAEEVTDWQEGKSFTVELSEFSLPVKSATATMNVEATGANRSEVAIAMELTPKFGALVGWLMGTVVMRPLMRKTFKQVLAGLEHHAATGELVGKDWKAPKSAPSLPAPAN